MGRNGVSNAMAAGLLLAGILIGAASFYTAGYQTKPATQTETTTARLTTAMTVTLPGVAEYPAENSSVSATVNETFIILLSSNAYDSGYVWDVTTSTGIQYFSYVVVPSSLGCCGRPQLYYYFFRAAQAGNGTITLQMERPSVSVVVSEIKIEVAVAQS